MRRVVSFFFAFLFFLSCALSENTEDRIIVMEDSTGEIRNPVPPKPFKPAHLAEVGKVTIGDDNRIAIPDTSLYPYSAIAFIVATSACGHSWYGSGFMIGDNLLLTAGHLVYCPECHTPANEIAFYFGYVNERNYLACNKGNNWKVHVTRQVAAGDNYEDFDYAFFVLDENIGETTGIFSLRYDIPDEDLEGLSFHVAGYRDGILKHDMGKVYPQSEQFLAHYADIEKQNSGCPVYDNDNYVIAIQSSEARDGSSNYAVRITRAIYQKMEQILLDEGV